MLEDVFRYVDDHFEDALQELERLCRLPTVSAQKTAIEETAAAVKVMLEECGFSVQIMPKPAGGHPVVYAELAGDSPRTLLLYNHYDVQPPEPLELWSSPPFEPVRRGGKLFGRGVSDNKGNLIARIAAIRALRAVRGSVPVSLKFCIEGDEEIGSPHMEEFIAEHRDILKADACLWEGGGVDWEGTPQVTLGVKGLLYVELSVTVANRDSHSSWATVVPNAAWRLVWALNLIKNSDEQVLIDGFYEHVRPPTPDELAAVAAMPAEEEQLAQSLGISGFLKGLRGVEYRQRHLFEPTATIDGLSSGYEGEGPKTVLPAQAMAKMDFRLVPDQDPDDIYRKLRRHLDGHGFSDIQVKVLSGERPARTPLTDPFVAVVSRAAEEVYGRKPVLVPTMAGTGPLYPFIATLNLPTADCGIGYPDTRIHAPDENIRIEDFRKGIKQIAAVLAHMAEG